MQIQRMYLYLRPINVKKKLDDCLKCYNDFIFTENMMRKCISKRKLGPAPGPDGTSVDI